MSQLSKEQIADKIRNKSPKTLDSSPGIKEVVKEIKDDLTLDDHSFIIDTFKHILGDEDAALSFINSSTHVLYEGANEEKYVVSPAYWAMLSLSPGMFVQVHLVILLHLQELKRSLGALHNDAEHHYNQALYIMESQIGDKKRTAYQGAKTNNRKWTESEAKAYAEDVVSNDILKYEEMKEEKRNTLYDIDNNLKYISGIIGAINGYVGYASAVGPESFNSSEMMQKFFESFTAEVAEGVDVEAQER